MEIIICPDTEATGKVASDLIEHTIHAKPGAVLGLATGSSPLPLYQELGRRVQTGKLSLSRTTCFTLDEYVGLPDGHRESYREVIRRTFTSRVDVEPDNVHNPNGNATDVEAEARSYETRIRAVGGIDVQILGIGANGHIGFNEPGSSLGSRTRIKTLLPQTRKDNARFFDSPDNVPRHVLTQGIGTIMEAKTIVLMASGMQKAEAIHRLAEGPVTTMCPGSILQLHPDVRVILDEPAASRLELSDYYRHTYQNKPAWQH
ncbi:glucosamine-6-phosphate deaminase [Arthrobacter sp. NPDC058127]|uniref:glucosamine-6-phosphate deaminase n=1 Tax=Arthrobacter sp. NPDC058127 TaxID=3346351 RepID=UPI0036E92203